MKKILKNNTKLVEAIGRLLPLSLAATVLIANIFFIEENPLRGVTILSLLFIWGILTYATKSYVTASLYLLLFVIPLNITITFPNWGDVYVRGVYSNFLSPTLSIIDIFVALLFISLLLKDFTKKIDLIYKILIGILVLSLIFQFSVLSLIGIGRIILYVLTTKLLFDYMKYEKEKLNMQFTIYVISTTVLIQVIIALSQVYLGSDLGLQFLGESQLTVGTIGSSFISLSEATYLRGYGTFPHPNILAGYLSFVVIILLGIPSKGKLVWVTIGISAIGILLTFSRLGWLLLLLVMVFYLLFGSRQQKGLNSFTLGIFGERISNLFLNIDTSFRDRILLNEHAVEVIQKNWLTGLGIGRYVSAMKELPIYTNSGLLLLQPVHNIFLLLVAEMGIGGIIFAIGIIYKILFYNFAKHSKFLYLSIIFFVLIFGMFDHFLLTLPQGLILLVFALLL